MAASARPELDPNAPITLKEIIPEANAIIRALLEEYLYYRTAANSPVQAVFGLFKKATGQDRSLERTHVCNCILDKIQKNYVRSFFISSMIEILILCEKEARDMQQQAAKNENAWVTSNASTCAKVLHAVRTCLFTGLKSSAMKEVFEKAMQTKTAELLAQLEANHTSMKNNIDAVDMTEFAIERDNLFGELVALQHQPSIKEAFIQSKFDLYKPLKEIAKDEFQVSNKIKLNKNIPDLFHPAYFFIYYLFNIKDHAERIMKYNNSYQSYLVDVTPSVIIESGESSYFTKMGGMVANNSVPIGTDVSNPNEKGENGADKQHHDDKEKPVNDPEKNDVKPEGADNQKNNVGEKDAKIDKKPEVKNDSTPPTKTHQKKK